MTEKNFKVSRDFEINESNLPNIRPSIVLDFKNTKKLDPRISFNRNSTGTYYDGTTIVKAEENLNPYSTDMGNTVGSIYSYLRGSVTSTTIAAPDGTNTAIEFEQGTGETTSAEIFISGSNFVSYTIPDSNYVMSVFAKANTKDWIFLRTAWHDASNSATWFDLSTGSVGNTNADHTATIQDFGNGWYRCSILVTTDSNSRLIGFEAFLADADASTTVTDSGSVYFWGPQLEQRDAITAYTPTSGVGISKTINPLITAPANKPRFDHDHITRESRGLLIEEQRTNIIPTDNPAQSNSTRFSSDFNTTDVIAPDGTQTGVLKAYWDGSETDPSGAKYMFFRDSAFTTTNIHTSSVYVYPVAETNLRMTPHSQYASDTDGGASAGGNAYFDCTGDGSVISFDGATIDAKIKNVGGGWYRISVTYYRNSTNPITSSYGVIVYSSSTVGSGAGELEFTGYYKALWYMWGPQVEDGQYPTSYIKTDTTGVTRIVDTTFIEGENLTKWFNEDRGTIFMQSSTFNDRSLASSAVLTTINLQLGIFDGNSNNRILVVREGRISGSNHPVNNNVITSPNKFAVNFESQEVIKSVLNGGTVNTLTFDILEDVISMDVKAIYFGRAVATAVWVLNGHIQKFIYFPESLSDEQLIRITESD